ncbi:MAG: hypothetical protein LBG46_02840 [Elusimicrobiota bacterium]|jgi:hypothetical protein|nr:hypothetical protein [Elusimicrobiota bacterium]
MKILKDGSMAFYRSRWRYFFSTTALVVCGLFIYFLLIKEGVSDTRTFALYFVFCNIIFSFAVFYFIHFLGIKHYLKLNDDYIEIKSLPPVLWEDIYEIYVEDRNVGSSKNRRIHQFLCFMLRDINFYKHKLSFFQKISVKLGKNIFAVDMDLLPKKDQDTLWLEVNRRIRKADVGLNAKFNRN